MEISQNAPLDYILSCTNIIRHDFIEDMENRLITFERKMKDKNFKVLWISDEEELTQTFSNLLPNKPYNKVCFDLTHTPESFHDIKGVKQIHFADVESGKTSATYLFTQADFAIVETGTLVLLNKSTRNCLNRVPNIFILLDISKMINRAADLETILYVRSFYQNQKFLPDDVKLINKPFQLVEKNMSSSLDKYAKQSVDITILLYDNGVSRIMQNNILRESLYCIDCGACKTVCPIYNYTKELSPIGIVRDNCLHHANNPEHITKNAMLCGNCDQVCPVQIPISSLILKEIELARKVHPNRNSVASVFEKRKKLNKMNGAFRRHFFTKKLFGKNKMLYSYFKQQKDAFYNYTWMQEHGEND
ncbi:MAG: hypothetical protein MJZ49_01190 [Bacteroidales bacterium]|nr:hypothetical protein [Bacteroidales bacterium]